MANNDRRYEVRIDRFFDVAPERLFTEWLDAEALKEWFAPQGFTGTFASADAVMGGHWEVEFQASDGRRFREYGTFREITPHSRIRMSLHQDFLGAENELTITVDFEAAAGGTRMRFHQSGFRDVNHRDAVGEGWLGCFQKLTGRVVVDASPEAEIRALFEEWYAVSARKDLDAAMAPISRGIVSYEHSGPLEVRDLARIREECNEGFNRAGPEFRWDVPDLQILIRGDIAITWGLNRMRDQTAEGEESETWSRGTRIFRHMEGRWQMIHQHVSFPMDPATGQACFDLSPARSADAIPG